jgi:hypothetical protein
MTTANESDAAYPPIQKPYARNPDAPEARRRRRLVLICASIFCLFYGFAFALFAPYLLLPLLAPLPVLGLFVIWALPEARAAPTRTLAALTFIFFVGLVMWPNYIAFAPPGLPWITMVRITGFPLVLVFLACLSVSADFRRELATSLAAVPLLWKALLTFAAIQLISIAFSANVGQSIDRFVVAQVSWTAIFFLSAYVFLTPGRVEQMAKMLWVMGILVGVIGIAEWRHAGVLWANHIPSFLKIPDPAVARALAYHSRGPDGVYRAESTFSTSLGLAEYVALILPFVIHFAVGAYRSTIRIAAALSIPLLLFVVNVTGARLGVIGCLMSFFLYGLIWAVLRWRRKRQDLVAPALIFAFPFAVLLTAFLAMTWTRFHVMVFGNGYAQYSTLARQEQLRMALPRLLHHPWGYGVSMGANTVGYFNAGGELTLDSYFITVAMEYGIIGFIVYYSYFLYAIYFSTKAIILSRDLPSEYYLLIPLAISLANFFVIKSVFSQQENHALVFMFVGMIVALCARMKKADAAGAQPAPVARPRKSVISARR